MKEMSKKNLLTPRLFSFTLLLITGGRGVDRMPLQRLNNCWMLGSSGQNNTFYLHAAWQFINRFPTWYFIYASYNLGCRNYLDLTCEQLQLRRNVALGRARTHSAQCVAHTVKFKRKEQCKCRPEAELPSHHVNQTTCVQRFPPGPLT